MIEDDHEVYSRGCFKIVNFMCSSHKVLEKIPEDVVAEKHKTLALEDDWPVERVLGLYWDSKEDSFSFRTSFKKFRPEVMAGECSPTKREVLAIVMTVYGPLGFLSHYTIKARMLLQDVWRINVGWDDELPEELFTKWKLWLEELSEISQVEISRYYTPRMSEGEVQLYVFADANEEAFSAVAYFRIDVGGAVSTSLIMAKAKVSPLKRLSVPKLQAAVLGTRMSESIRIGHRVEISSTYCWSDSSTVLSWIKTDTKRLPVFVAHRVGEIVGMTDIKEWHWITTKENVADDATRSGTPKDFRPTARWFTRPMFMRKDKSHWPKELSEKELRSKVNKDDLKLDWKMDYVGVIESIPAFIVLSGFSNWGRVKRALAYVFIIQYRRKKIGEVAIPPSKLLTATELEKSKTVLLRHAQGESLEEEAATLEKGRMILKNSRIVKLSPMMDERGLIYKRDLCLRKQWRKSQALADQFWKRWIAEYVPSLTLRSKWHQSCTPVKIGDLVFILDGNFPRNSWLRGKVEATYPEKDGLVRIVDVRTSRTVYRRPVSKMAVLDVFEYKKRIDPEPNSRGEDVVTGNLRKRMRRSY